MDIEGYEYEAISCINETNLNKFKILVIEFHHLEYSGIQLIYKIIKSAMEKLLKNFEIAHIHANNWKKKTKINNFKFPSNLEVTFLNKKFVITKENLTKLPHLLDRKNVPFKEDIILDDYWFK